MSWPEVLIHAVVLLVGFPAATRNATAAALCLSWLFGQSIWWITGDNLPLRYYLLADLTVLAVIYMKTPARDLFPYRSFSHQLAAFWLERSMSDRIVLGIFPIMWALYALPVSEYHRWWGLYWLCIAQFIAAAHEALQPYFAARKANAGKQPDSPSARLEYAWAGSFRGYG